MIDGNHNETRPTLAPLWQRGGCGDFHINNNGIRPFCELIKIDGNTEEALTVVYCLCLKYELPVTLTHRIYCDVGGCRDTGGDIWK